jgi:transposase InsO family protein
MVRRIMVLGESPRDVATSRGLSPKTVRKWLRRVQAAPGEPAALQDHSSRPLGSPQRTSAARREEVIELRRRRLNYAQIAELLQLSKPTICRILRQAGLNRLSRMEPAEPVVRYERAQPGELLHFDIKKLGKIEIIGHRITGDRTKRSRGAGWEYLHVVIDDHSRLAFAALLPCESQLSAIPFLEASLAFFSKLGVKAQRVMTDNGSCYRSKSFALKCKNNELRHVRTRPYRPKTNGKAERFIQTICREWAYAQSYAHSDERQAHLLPWLHRYNWHRPHTALKNKAPISRSPLSGDNLVRLHT